MPSPFQNISDKFQRQKRILGRQFNGKGLPRFVYRQDARAPQEIRDAGGFHPWGQGPVELLDHVQGTYSSGDKAGTPVKHDSNWVSTASWRAVESLNGMDGVIAQRLLSHYLYKIDTEIAGADQFFDVNDAFDRAGIKFGYRKQREWIKNGSIAAEAIVGWMEGAAFYALLNGGVPPAEDSADLVWNPLP